MAGEWPLRKLADVCDSVDYGYTASAIDSPCGPKFLRITDIVLGYVDWNSVPYCKIDDSLADRFRLDDGDIVIARTGATTGYSVYIANPPNAVFASYLVRLKTGKEADSRFIAYFLKSSRFWDYMRGVLGEKSAQPNASAKTMTQAKLLLPPVKQQRAISRILGTLDDKIELNRRMNETLESIALAIFKSWFVDFDPVRTKMEGRQPAEIDVETAALFPDSFEESPIGQVPADWGSCLLSDVIELIGGGTPKTSVDEYWGGDIPWFSVADVPRAGDVYVIRTEKNITNEGLDGSSARLLPKGTTIITARGTVGKCALVGVPMAMNQSCYGVRPKDSLGDYYTYFLIRHSVGELQQKTHGSVFETITRETFNNIEVTCPPPQMRSAFEKTVAPFLESILCNLYESNILAEIRDKLLPKLIFGEAHVKDAEKFVEEHAG